MPGRNKTRSLNFFTMSGLYEVAAQSVQRLDYGLDGPGFKSRREAIFPAPVQTGPGAHLASYTVGTGSFPGK